MNTDRYVERATELIRKRIAADPNWNVLSVVPEEDWFRTVSVSYQLFPIFINSRALNTVEALLVEARRPTWGERLAQYGGLFGRELETLDDDPRSIRRLDLTLDLELALVRRGDPVDAWGPEFPSEQPDSELSSQAGLTWRWKDAYDITVAYIYYSPSDHSYGVDVGGDTLYPEGEYYQHFATPEDAFAFVKRLRNVRLLPRKPGWRPR